MVFGSTKLVLYLKVSPDIDIEEASVPETPYFRKGQYAFEKVNPPRLILLFVQPLTTLDGFSFTTVYVQAL